MADITESESSIGIDSKLEAYWERYRTEVLPLGLSPSALEILKVAFFGGASSLLSILSKTVKEDGFDVKKGFALFASLFNEVENFMEHELKNNGLKK